MPVLPTTPAPRRLHPSVALPFATRWSSVAVALWLAACVHSPQAAVSAPVLQGEPTLWEHAAPAPCDKAPAARSALERIGRELQSHGMALQATCNTTSGGWVVQVQVVDGTKAHKVVRGPLADGQAVDMGTPAGAARSEAAAGASGFSPDVLHNRRWLRALMARHQFDNLPDAWWHFAQRGVPPAQAADTDLAAR
ncbi:D-Ala-D-Ala dipeptidase [Acidovorax sp. D2M1]|uniref:D-Ala-D-Ala dipeptidase n=1 Tax=Acidovorax benzenivorans TaxID=2987520 RepID=A0ABT5RYU0_9BURK|nr:M15 family metallopeptidase [Acidovorax benzenivorans]MDD2178073.1 D-Ala-D-Ala dipeptidase [Acidovorax benzenivorans]